MSTQGPLGSRRNSLVQKRNPKKSATQSENGTSATAATNGSFLKPPSPVHSTSVLFFFVFYNSDYCVLI